MKEHQIWRRMAGAAAALVLAWAGVRAQGGSGDSHDHASAERVALIAKALSIGPGASVADVGAGAGDYAIRLAGLVGDAGRVYAVDIDPGALAKLRTRIERDGRSNVVVQEGAVDDPRLPEASLDAALIVHAYHEMTEHRAMLARLRAALKPGGRLAIVTATMPAATSEKFSFTTGTFPKP